VGDLLVGVDVGTSRTKGILTRADGAVLARVERAHGVSRPQPGWVEQDPDGVWWDDVCAVSRELTGAAGPGDRIAAAAVSALGPCVVLADRDGRPLRPAILYGVDTRARGEIAELTARFGATEVLERGGSPLTSQAAGPKLLWLRRHEPEAWARAQRFFTASSYLLFRLTGEYLLDHHSASQCDPLYDVGENGWIDDWAAAVAPGLPLPELRWPQEVVGHVTAEAAAATGLPKGIPVAAGTIDSWAEVFASGVREPGVLLLVYGTTLFMAQVLTSARPHPGLWGTTSFRPGTRNCSAGLGSAGALSTWFRDLVGGGVTYDQLLEEAAGAPAGAGGLVALPYFAGERTPLFDPDARGVVAGLTLDHGRGHLYRALLESTAYGVRHNLETMGEAGAPPAALVAAGGGRKRRVWSQIVADVTGRRQELLDETVGGSLGTALLAAVAAGLADLTTNWGEVVDVVEPRPQLQDIYGPLYEIYRRLGVQTLEAAHALARLQGAVDD
jgi:xylulokinase